MAASLYLKLWRLRDAESLADLRLALKVAQGSPKMAATLLGVKPSALWRVAYAVPEVIQILREGSRGPGRRKKGT